MPPSGRVKLGRDSQLIDLDLDRSGGQPLNEQLYKGIKSLILAGVLRSGARLPASRILARELEISRNTVLAAYDQLLARGCRRTCRTCPATCAPPVRCPRMPRHRRPCRRGCSI